MWATLSDAGSNNMKQTLSLNTGGPDLPAAKAAIQPHSTYMTDIDNEWDANIPF